jgi:nitric-oxide synthase
VANDYSAFIYSSMAGCPFHSSEARTSPLVKSASVPTHAAGDPVEAALAFLSEAHTGAIFAERLSVCRAAVATGGPAPLTSAELTWAGRIAWRNHARCIGRLYWRTLTVRDHRHLDTADELAASLREHLTLAQGDGGVRSFLTVFAPPGHSGGPAPRIWNHQLCAYAGYCGRDGSILGDSKNAELTARALALGWQPPAERSRFDLLPWIVAGRNGRPQLFSFTRGLVREVTLRHPTLPWFEKLGLRWYAVPVISDMRLHAAGTDYPAAPFNGWYMGTEIGARNLADTDRYNQLPVIAEKLGLDCRSPRTLWQDRALLELNAAVLHSYEADGIKLVDHHTASAEFMKFREREKSAGREVSARWDWIVPPMSPATTPVFHSAMHEFPTTPDFHSQKPAWG